MKLNANLNYTANYTPNIKKKYEVDIAETFKRTVEVLAVSEDNAYELVDDLINDGEIDLPCDGGGYNYSRDLFVGKSEDISKWKKVKNPAALEFYSNVESYILDYAVEKINSIMKEPFMGKSIKQKISTYINTALKARSKGLITIDECIHMICDCLSNV